MVVSPSQAPPGGQTTHVQSCFSVDVSSRNWLLPQKVHDPSNKKAPWSHRHSVGEVEPGGAEDDG